VLVGTTLGSVASALTASAGRLAAKVPQAKIGMDKAATSRLSHRPARNATGQAKKLDSSDRQGEAVLTVRWFLPK